MPGSSSTPDQFMERQVNNIRLLQQLAEHYTTKLGTEISSSDIRLALFELLKEKEDLRTVIDVWGLTMTLEQAISILDGFSFGQFRQFILVDGQTLPEHLLPQGYATIKNGGKQWRIHLNDADPWPSKPHAHLTGTTYVLDLSNGDFYKGRQLQTRIPYKELISVRSKFSELPAFKGTLPNLTI